MGANVFATIGSIIAGGVVATVTVVGLVSSQTSPSGQSPTDVNQPVTIDESSATIEVAAAASPAVVRITIGGSVDTSTGIIPETGVGSGVIYDANGWILTNRHVVEGSDTLTVELNDGRTFSGRVYGIDRKTGDKSWDYEAGGKFVASPAIASGRLVIGNTNGTLFCFGEKK